MAVLVTDCTFFQSLPTRSTQEDTGRTACFVQEDRNTFPMEMKNQQSLPVITVGKFHVHAMATQEGLAVQGDIDV